MGMCRKKVVLYEEVSGTLTCAPGIFRLYSSEVFVSFYLPFSIGGFRFFFFLRTRLLAVQSSLERFAFLFSRRTKIKKEKEMQWARRTRERRGDCSIETWTSSPDVFLRCCVTSIPVGAHEGYVLRSPSDYLLAALLAKSFNFDDCNILISSFVSFYSRNKLLTRRKWRKWHWRREFGYLIEQLGHYRPSLLPRNKLAGNNQVNCGRCRI